MTVKKIVKKVSVKKPVVKKVEPKKKVVKKEFKNVPHTIEWKELSFEQIQNLMGPSKAEQEAAYKYFAQPTLKPAPIKSGFLWNALEKLEIIKNEFSSINSENDILIGKLLNEPPSYGPQTNETKGGETSINIRELLGTLILKLEEEVRRYNYITNQLKDVA